MVCELGMSHMQRVSQEPRGQGRVGSGESARQPRCPSPGGTQDATLRAKAE